MIFTLEFELRQVILPPTAFKGKTTPEFCATPLSLEFDLDTVKTNHRAKYLDQRPFRSKFIVWKQTHRHIRPSALLGPLKWSVKTVLTWFATNKIVT